MPKIGIEIIGCGDIARARYFPAIQASPDFELRGVQSRTTAACEPLAARYGGKIFADLGTLLNAPEIEAVVVSTPHPSHADISVRCLEGGKHVLCEKPVATSLVDASSILRAAERSGKVFMALPFDGALRLKPPSNRSWSERSGASVRRMRFSRTAAPSTRHGFSTAKRRGGAFPRISASTSLVS